MLIASESSVVTRLPELAETSFLPSKKDILLEAGQYRARLALTAEERAEAFRLRFVVFNLELNEGLA